MKLITYVNKNINDVFSLRAVVNKMNIKHTFVNDILVIDINNFSRIYFAGPIQFIDRHGGWKSISISKENDRIRFDFELSNRINIKILLIFSILFFLLACISMLKSSGFFEVFIGWMALTIIFTVFLCLMHIIFFFRLRLFIKKITSNI